MTKSSDLINLCHHSSSLYESGLSTVGVLVCCREKLSSMTCIASSTSQSASQCLPVSLTLNILAHVSANVNTRAVERLIFLIALIARLIILIAR